MVSRQIPADLRWRWLAVGLCVGSIWLSSAACSNFGLKNWDLLREDLPQSFYLRYPAEKVWVALLVESEIQGRSRVLAVDEATRTLSWIASVDASAGSHESLTDMHVAKRGKSVPAITVVHVEELELGCRIFVRQTYFPAKSRVGIAPSRGAYEKTLIQAIEEKILELEK